MEKNLLWHDPEVFNQENKEFCQKFSKEFANFRRFHNTTDVFEFLHNERKRWIVITSGSKGKELIEKINQLPSVLGVVFFCANKEFHANWSKDYPIVKGLYSDFEALMKKIKSLHEEYVEQIVEYDFERQKQLLDPNTLTMY
jgi:FMN phosphatase YigB (HAD superfamily)